MAPRQPIPVREILYQLSPYQQDVIKQTIYNAPKTFLKFWKEVRKNLPLCVNPCLYVHALTQQSTVCSLDYACLQLQKGVGLATLGVGFFGIKG